MDRDLFDQHLDTLERKFQALHDQIGNFPEVRDDLAPALQEVAQALELVRTAQEEAIPASSETILHHVFQAIPDLLTVDDEDLNVILSNWKGHEFITAEERRGRPKCYQVFLHRDRPCEPCIVQEVFATGQPAKREHYNPVDGQTREIHAFPVLDQSGRATLVAKHIRNLTPLRQAEAALEEREELYRVLTERSLAGVYLIQDGKFRYANPKMAQIFGYTQEEIIDRLSPWDLIDPNDHPLLEEQMRLRLSGEAEEAHYTLRGVRRDGTVILSDFLGRRVEYQGRPAIMGTLLDITERHRAEEALQTQALVLASMAEGVHVVNEDGMIVFANPAAYAMFGYPEGELIGQSVTVLNDLPPEESERFSREIIEHLQKQGSWFGEVRNRTKDGHSFPTYVRVSTLDLAGEKLWISVQEDITARKHLEDTLKGYVKFIQVLMEAIPLSVFYKNTDHIILGCNRAFASIAEVPQQDIPGKTVFDLFSEELAREWDEADKQALEYPGTLVKLEFQLPGPGNTPRHMICHNAAYLDSSGSPGGVVSITTDITELKQTAAALRESEANYRELVENANSIILRWDPQGRITLFNKFAQQLFGYSEEEIIGKEAVGTIVPEVESSGRDLASLLEDIMRHPDDYRTNENENITKSGERLWVSWTNKGTYDSEGNLKEVLCIGNDITAKKEMQQALSESEARLQAIINNAQDVIFVKDRFSRYTQVNPAMERLFHQPAASFLGRTDQELFGEEDAAHIRTQDQTALNGDAVTSIVNLSILGEPVTFHVVKVPLQDGSGQVIGLCGIARDITALQRTKEALKASEARYRLLADNVHDVLWMMDVNYALTYVSPSVKNMTGYTSEEFLSLGLRQIVLPAYHQVFGTSLEKLRAPGMPPALNYEVEYRRKDNSIGWAEITVTLMRDSQGLIKGLTGLCRDITSRKQAEEALQASEARYRTLFETSPNAMVLMDLQMNIIMANHQGLKLFEYDNVAEILGRNGLNDFAPEDRSRIMAPMQKIAEAGHVPPLEVNMLTRDGRRIPCLVSASLVRDATGEPQAILGVAQDISNLKRVEEALATYLQFMRVLLDAIPNPIFYEDIQGAFWGCNKAFEAFLGVTQQEIVGKLSSDLFLQNLINEEWQMGLETFHGPGPRVYETILKADDGEVRNVIFHKATFPGLEGNIAGLVGVIQDITGLRRVEEAVRESEARLRAIFEYAPIGIIMSDCQGRFLQVNPAYEALLGYSAAELQGMTVKQLTHPEDFPEQLRLREELMAGQRQYYSIEKRNLRKDGGIVWVNVMAARLHNAQGELRTVGTVIDITARKRAEEALRESEQRFRLMAETIQDAFWIAPAAFDKLLYVSPGYERIWGHSVEGLLLSPQAFMNAIHPEDLEQVKGKLLATLAHPAPWSHEYRIIRPDGEVRWIQDRGFPLKGEEDSTIMFTGVATDITARKTLEQQLLLAQKMEAVGRLAGGVAHDFNNLLMAITSYAELIRQKILKDDPLYGYLEDIFKATDRATALTGQLLTFSRQQVVRPLVIDLNKVVMDLKRMLRRLIAEDIELKIITTPNLGPVKADPGYLNQIIMNLVINARDALLCGGQIIVETGEVKFDQSRRTRFGEAPPGSYVVLEVSDSGIGMDEDMQTHIFEPFFTTKEPGKGTGLGLSIVYGIIKQSGGFIDLESEPGFGSTFTIYWPRVEAEAEPTETRVLKQTKFRGDETILLVEDEDVLRALLAKFLRLHGYTVLEARHGKEALLLCEQYQEPIHMMVTDVVMPQMSGRVLADRLSPLRPEMKVLYMSGYNEDEVVQRGVADLSVAFLQKPFKPIDLARQVYATLHPQVIR